MRKILLRNMTTVLTVGFAIMLVVTQSTLFGQGPGGGSTGPVWTLVSPNPTIGATFLLMEDVPGGGKAGAASYPYYVKVEYLANGGGSEAEDGFSGATAWTKVVQKPTGGWPAGGGSFTLYVDLLPVNSSTLTFK